MEKPTVPKFGSFKTKQNTKLDARNEDQIQDRDRSERRHRDSKYDRRDRHSHRDSEHHEHRPRHRKSQREPPRDKDRHREHRRKSPSTERAIEQDVFDESSLYIVDRRGDAKNVIYGSLHRYSIPSYRTAGYGNVVGASLSTKIDRDESNDKEVVLHYVERSRHAVPRPLATKQGRTNDQRLRFVTGDVTKSEENSEADFIDLMPSRKRKRDADFSAADLAEAVSVDYRSIEGKAKQPARPKDEDLAFATQSDSDGADEDASLKYRQENAVLSKQAKADPSEWERWLALVTHQANLVRPGLHASSFATSERKTLADLRLTILHEASRHIGKGAAGYADLLLRTIEEGRYLWDNGKTRTKWKEALQECPESILLWTKYLDHIQHDHTAFRYESYRDTYLQCLKMLKEARRKDQDSDHGIAKVQVFVLLRLTSFVRDAGYGELSIAIWQATLESQIFRPLTTDEADEVALLASFEDFWESEAPRVGEEGAKGWADYAAGNTNGQRKPAKPTASTHATRDPFASFAAEEADLSGFILPTTMDDEDATVDPFRCVLFDDIRDVLSTLSVPLPKQLLVQAFLAFMTLPTLPARQDEVDARLWLLDQHILTTTSDALAANQEQHSTNPGVRYHAQTTSLFFISGFEAFDTQRKTTTQDTEDRALFTNRLLGSLVDNDPDDEILAEYYLAFKLHLFPDQAAKTAKRLLKARSSSLRLYNAYALVQSKLSGLDQAQNFWALALKMGGNDVVLLWHTRLLAQVSAGDEKNALRTLLALSGGEEGSDDRVRRLKTTRLFEDVIDRSLLQQTYEHAVMAVDCLVWLEYLASGSHVTSALQVCDKYAGRLRKHESMLALELLHQYKCGPFSYHIDRKRAYKPSLLRSELEASLKEFPNNTIFLELHSKIAAQDRLRAMFQQQQFVDIENRSIVQWSHQLSTEIQHLRNGTSGATVNSVRASFKNALLGIDSQVAHAPALWMAWLYFEQQNGSVLKVKQVFLDGVRYLPWHKHWIITGMNMLSKGGMSRSELRQVYETMVERGLRVRIEIEDAI